MNEYLHQLSDNPECEGDKILVLHVRMQLVTEKVALATWYDSCVEPADSLCLPSLLVYQTSYTQLDEIRKDVPTSLRDSSKSLFTEFNHCTLLTMNNRHHLLPAT